MPPPLRVLGLDPGSNVTGWGVIEMHPSRPRHLAHGCITVRGQAFHERLKQIYDELQLVLDEYQPHEASLEDIFFAANAQSALKLGQARGVALIAVLNRDIPVFSYAPMQIKLALVGHGRAEKEQVGWMVKQILGLPQIIEKLDASDALAAAICHAMRPASSFLIPDGKLNKR